MTDKKTRTALQNRSIHLYFKLLAYELNEAGFDVMKTMSHDIEIPWNEHLVKELIWRKVQKVMTDKRSTTRLDTSKSIIVVMALLIESISLIVLTSFFIKSLAHRFINSITVLLSIYGSSVYS